MRVSHGICQLCSGSHSTGLDIYAISPFRAAFSYVRSVGPLPSLPLSSTLVVVSFITADLLGTVNIVHSHPVCQDRCIQGQVGYPGIVWPSSPEPVVLGQTTPAHHPPGTSDTSVVSLEVSNHSEHISMLPHGRSGSSLMNLAWGILSVWDPPSNIGGCLWSSVQPLLSSDHAVPSELSEHLGGQSAQVYQVLCGVVVLALEDLSLPDGLVQLPGHTACLWLWTCISFLSVCLISVSLRQGVQIPSQSVGTGVSTSACPYRLQHLFLHMCQHLHPCRCVNTCSPAQAEYSLLPFGERPNPGAVSYCSGTPHHFPSAREPSRALKFIPQPVQVLLESLPTFLSLSSSHLHFLWHCTLVSVLPIKWEKLLRCPPLWCIMWLLKTPSLHFPADSRPISGELGPKGLLPPVSCSSHLQSLLVLTEVPRLSGLSYHIFLCLSR